MFHKRRKNYYGRRSSNLMPTLFVLVVAMVAALGGALYWDKQQDEAEAAELAALSQPVVEEEITLPDPEADGVVAVTEESEETPAESSEEEPAEEADEKSDEEQDETNEEENEEANEEQPQEIKAVTSTAGSTVAECAEVDASYFIDAAFVGDSLTQGLQLYDILDTNVIANRGINLESIYTSVFAELERVQPAKIYIQLGMNDIAWRTEKDFTRLYGELIDKVHDEFPDAELYIQSIFPVTNWYALEDNGIDNEKVVTFNQHLLDLCVEKGCHYLDVHSALMDENGVLPDAASPDGIHLNAPYYKNWFNYLKTHVA